VKRRLFQLAAHLATLLSLLLCAAAAVAWKRSYRVHDDLWFGAPHWAAGVGPFRGAIVFYQVTSGPYSLAPGFHHTPGPPQDFDVDFFKTHSYSLWSWKWDRLSYVNAVGSAAGFRQRFLSMPAWAVCAVTAVLPMAWLVRRLGAVRKAGRRARARRGLCPECGYDLTGNESGVCPECGRAATAGLVGNLSEV
jgi:hypothetical protein